MEYLTTVEMSEKWGITARRIAYLCKEGRVFGVLKKEKHGLFQLSQRNQKMQEKLDIDNER